MEEKKCRGRRERWVSVKEMNEHLRYISKNRYLIKYEKYENGKSLCQVAYIEDLMVYFKLTYKFGSFAATYELRKDGDTDLEKTSGHVAFQTLSKYYKIPIIDRRFCGRADQGGLSASPFMWTNPEYEGRWISCIGYDLNRAYGNAMLKPIPDTSVPMRSGEIEVGKEVGFLEVENPRKNNNSTMLIAIYEGWSPYIFPLMPSPFEGFVKNWDKRIRTAKTEAEKNKAKGTINMAIGYMQHKNPFIRAAIVNNCNDYIKSLIDENTVYCNTDSIVSLEKRDDLELGDKIGQWKIENVGLFAYKGFQYQWKNQKFSIRGTPKSWINEIEDWDILKNERPEGGNIIVFDQEKMQLKEVKGK